MQIGYTLGKMTKSIINLGYSASKSIATHTGPFVKNFMDGMNAPKTPLPVEVADENPTNEPVQMELPLEHPNQEDHNGNIQST